MAFRIEDRVKETTNTTGTGDLTLAGAVTSFRTFSDTLNDGDTFPYAVVNRPTGEYETGIGTYTSATGTISRDTILESSNSGSAVDFKTGPKTIGLTALAERSVQLASAPTQGQRIHYDGSEWTPFAEDYNAVDFEIDPANTGAANTTGIRAMIDAAKAAGADSLTVAITKPGTYELDEAGQSPYDASHRHCIDIDVDNLRFVLGSGVTLKLADGQQTDANGAVDMIVFEARQNVAIVGVGPGRSRITGNTAGQTGWTGGYSQASTSGSIIRGSTNVSDSTENDNTVVAGLQLDDHWSHSVTVKVGKQARRIIYRDLDCFDCGEGPDINPASPGGQEAVIENVTFRDPSDVCVGSGIQVTRFHGAHLSKVVVQTNGQGPAIELSGCKNITVDGFDIDGWTTAFGLTNIFGNTTDRVTISNGVIRNLTGEAFHETPEGYVQVSNVLVVDCDRPLDLDDAVDNARMEFKGVRFIDCTNEPLVRKGVNVKFSDCEFRGMPHGLVVQRTTADVPDVVCVDCSFIDNDGDGFRVDGDGSAFSPTGLLRDPEFSGNGGEDVVAVNSGTLDNIDMDTSVRLPVGIRPAAGITGRGIFGVDDGLPNWDNGSSWLTPDGTAALAPTKLSLPGESGDYASTPDAAALRITGDIDFRFRVAADDWTALGSLAARWDGGTSQRSYWIRVESDGTITLFLSEAGASSASASSSAAVPFSDGELGWVRVTWRASDGRVQFFTSDHPTNDPDNVPWTQLGSDQTLSITDIHAGNQELQIGARDDGFQFSGDMYVSAIYNGIDGTKVFDVDFNNKTVGATSVTEDANDATVTINQSGDPVAEIVAT